MIKISSSHINRALFFFGFCFISTTQADVIGKLSGEMSVNRGSLSYQLPLDVPAGVQGMKPELTLSYSQQGLNGSVGPGFSLSASSAISRCTPNQLNDGFESGIQLDELSRFCHDGQRLVAISGTDGTSGAEYRTFDNNNVKYVSNGGSNYTPDSWTVNVPDGTVLEFERRGSSQSEFATWYVTEKSDLFSNSINYSYSEGAVADIKSIEYSGYEISFIYEPKLESIGQYQAGEYTSSSNLLDKIEVHKTDGTLLFYYDLSYEIPPETTNIQRLSSVTKCFNSSDCLKPVEFGYKDIPDPTPTIDRSSDQIIVIPRDKYTSYGGIDETPIDERPAFVAADVNGDGFEDFCYYRVRLGIQCAIYDGHGGYEELEHWSSNLGYKSDAMAAADGEGEDAGDYKSYAGLNLQDLNADGKADFCITDEEGVRCGLSNGSYFPSDSISYWTTNITNEHAQALLRRINDDEYLDICGYDENLQYKCYAGSGNGFDRELYSFNEPDFVKKTSWTYHEPTTCAGGRTTCIVPKDIEYEINYPSATWIDVDGDFDQDFCWVSQSQKAFTCKYASTDPYTKELEFSQPEALIDLSSMMDNFVEPSSADVFDPAEHESLESALDEVSQKAKALTSSFQYANLNGDNLVDICYVSANELKCHINSGAGYLSATSWLDLTSLLSSYEGKDNEESMRNAKLSALRLVDRNLDGRSDVCVIHSEVEQCAYNSGSQFESFEDRLKIFPDIAANNQLVEQWTSFMHKLFGGERTHFKFQSVRAAYGNLIEVGDLSGDGYSELCYRSIDGIVCSTNDNYGPVSLLTEVTDSYGLTTSVNYGNLLLDNLYDPAEQIPNGFFERPGNMSVVASLETEVATVQGIDGTLYKKRVNYRYGGYLVNPVEKVAGFTSMSEIQADRNVWSKTQFYMTPKLFGQEFASSQFINNVLVKYDRNDFSVDELSNGTRRLLLDETESRQYDLTGRLVSTNITTNEQYDDYGRPQLITLNKTHGSESLTTVTETIYENDTYNWILGRAKNQTVRHMKAGDTITRKVDFVYTDGVLTQKTTQALAKNAVTETYSNFTSTGYPQRIETTGLASRDGATQTRFITKTYDDLGRVLTETNALSQTITYEYHAKCGGVEFVTDIAGRQSQTYYNDYCQKVKETAPDQNETRWTYEWTSAEDNSIFNRPANPLAAQDYYNPAVYKITETKKTASSSGDFWTTVYYDAQGRAVRTESTGFSTQSSQRVVNTATIYDRYGYKTAQSRPYFSNSNGIINSVHWITMEYDATGRPKSETKTGPDGNPLTVNYSYTGSSSTISYSDYSKTTINGIHGKPKSVTENGLTIEYEYNPIGDLTLTRNANGLETTVSYDSRGFKINQKDPSLGEWEYEYNAFGELIYQKDAKQQVIAFTYDLLGRKKTRTAPEGTTSWQYFNSGNGIGQLSHEYGISADKEWLYDSLGRVSSETLKVSDKTFTTAYNYNGYGQLIETIQPNGVSVFHKYDNIGKLQNVSLLASDFQDVNFEFLAEQKLTLSAEVERLRTAQKQALAKAEYHQRKAVEYNNQYNYFVGQLAKVTQELAQLGDIAEEHKKKAEEYFALYSRLTKKAKQLSDRYGGKTFRYDSSRDDGEYYYYTRKYCVSHHGWGPTRYCAKHQTDTVPVLQSSMDTGPKDTINPASFYEEEAADYQQLYLAESQKYNTIEVGTTTNKAVSNMTASEIQAAISRNEQRIATLQSAFDRERQELIYSIYELSRYPECVRGPFTRKRPRQPDETYYKYDQECHDNLKVQLKSEHKLSIKSKILYSECRTGPFYKPKTNQRGTIKYYSYDQSCLINLRSRLESIIDRASLYNGTCSYDVDYLDTSRLEKICSDAMKPIAELTIYQDQPLSAYYKPVEETYTEDVMVPILNSGSTIMIPATATKTRIIQQEISANEALTYYKQQRDSYFAKAGEAIEKAKAEMEELDTDINSDLALAEESLALVEEQMGIIDSASLDHLISSQSSLASSDAKLTVWHVANRTAEGHLQSEIFGNGLYTHRDINNETGLVSNIKTGVVAGSTIRDIAYEYDARGRIVSKIDSSAHADGTFDIRTSETFEYNDPQGRLSDWTFSQTIQETAGTTSGAESVIERESHLNHSYEHDSIGNLTYKSNAGTMVYSQDTNRLSSREHDGVTTSYQYDNNGNLIQGDNRSYQWTSFNKAASISMAGGQSVDFKYDASRKRVVKQTANETRYYVNPGYELVERTRNGVKETVHRYTISHEHDQVAVFEKVETEVALDETDEATYADSISYVHRDILGSGELITDSRMNILARQFFSPYGEKTDDLLEAQAKATEHEYEPAQLGAGLVQSTSDDLGAATWREFKQENQAEALVSRFKAGSATKDLSGVRGFTSHEAIEELGLINMNARLYDPVIGRFMSADTIVPDLHTPLDHNRYSYVRGNPVVSRDPTGHSPFLVALAVFAMAHYGDNETYQLLSTVALNVAMMNPGTSPFSFAAGTSATANAAMYAGFTSITISYLKTGKLDKRSVENAGIAAASAGLTHSIAHGWIGETTGITGGDFEWAKITAAHMVTQGAISDLRGDKFIHGAISGLVSKASYYGTEGMGTFYGTIIASTLSGVAAEATGGDFAKGAMTGAIIHLYNDMAGTNRKSSRTPRKPNSGIRLVEQIQSVQETDVVGGTRGIVGELLGLLVPPSRAGQIGKMITDSQSFIQSEIGSHLDNEIVEEHTAIYKVEQFQRDVGGLDYYKEDGRLFQIRSRIWINHGEPISRQLIDRVHSRIYEKPYER